MESNSIYKFGSGQKLKALTCLKLPCKIGSYRVNIMVDIVDAKIPLLLSKTSMKRATMIIDLYKDQILIFGKKLKLEITSIGHYILTLSPPDYIENLENTLINIKCDNLENIALKLHKQFGHPHSGKLRKFD